VAPTPLRQVFAAFCAGSSPTAELKASIEAAAGQFHQFVVFDYARRSEIRALGSQGDVEAFVALNLSHLLGGAFASDALNAYQHAVFANPSNWRTLDSHREIKTAARDRLEKVLIADLERRGPTPSNQLGLASLAHLAEDFENCAKHLAMATERHCDADPLRTYQFGAATYLPPLDPVIERVQKHSADRTAIEIHRKPEKCEVGPVITMAMDSVYFELFAPEFVAALSVFAPYSAHFHVINPKPATFNLFEKLNSNTALSLGFSYEKSNKINKAYYATCRFLQASELLELIGQDICIHDADIALQVDPRNLYSGWREYDAGFLRRAGYPAHVPWRTVTAQALFLNYSPVGVTIADWVSQCAHYGFTRRIANENLKWWVDQNILYFASKTAPEEANLMSIPASIMKSINHIISYKKSKNA